jgi:hypothetical protein
MRKKHNGYKEHMLFILYIRLIKNINVLYTIVELNLR